MNEPFNETMLAAALDTNWLGRRLEYFPVIDSTNDYLRDRLTTHSGMLMPHGMMVIADFQTHGRGRLNRRWLAPPHSSLTFSILFRSGWPPERANWLTMLAGLAAAQAIQDETGLAVGLKWPNDVMIERDGQWYKVGGLLLEADFGDGEKLRHAVLGIGINVNIPAGQLPTPVLYPATSLLIELGRPVSRLRLLGGILRQLEERYGAAATGETPQPAWNQKLITLGRIVHLETSEQTPISGIAIATDEWGHLLVQDSAGHLHTITAGDVRGE